MDDPNPDVKPASDEAAQPQPEPETPEQPQPDDHPSREAANYRKRLRETEAERDALRQRIDDFERREAEAIAAKAGIAVPGDLWLVVPTLDELRNGSGQLDPGLVQERVNVILKERPTWRRPSPDLGAGARSPVSERTPGLSDLLKPGKR
jgi:hypothetical protein